MLVLIVNSFYLRVAVRAGIVLRKVKNIVPKVNITNIHILLQSLLHMVFTASYSFSELIQEHCLYFFKPST